MAILTTDPLNLKQRLKRPAIRPLRTRVVHVRLTEDEHAKLKKLAASSKLFLGEWTRTRLLSAPQDSEMEPSPVSATDCAIFTELVLLRSIVEALLPSISIGQKLAPEEVRLAVNEARAGKYESAREALDLYLNPLGEKA